MNTFLNRGKTIVQSFSRILSKIDPHYGFVIGGGLGYESIKYDNGHNAGDYDFIVALQKDQDVIDLICDSNFFNKIGFREGSFSTVSENDIKLYLSGTVSLLGMKGLVDGDEVSLNLTTFDNLSSILGDTLSHKYYKLKHGSLFNPFLARGSNGKELLVFRISPDITETYHDNRNHYITTHDTWYKNGDCLHFGIHSDFVAKGIISHDDQTGTLGFIQKHLWTMLKTYASPEMKRNQKWHKMLASSNFFSEEYIKYINKSISDIKPKRKNQSSYLELFTSDRAPIVVMARPDLYPRTASAAEISLADFQNKHNQGDKLEFMEQLKLINADTVYLSKFINHSGEESFFNKAVKSLKASKNEISNLTNPYNLVKFATVKFACLKYGYTIPDFVARTEPALSQKIF